MLTVQEAIEIILREARSARGETEEVPLLELSGRALAEDITSDRDYPPFNRAMMDGFALSQADYAQGIREYRVVQDIFAGSSGRPLGSGECARIMTGAPVPEGGDAVIKVEESRVERDEEGGERVFFEREKLEVWTSVARQGENARAGEVILSRGSVCTPPVQMTLAAVGRGSASSYALPDVAVISTGDELRSLEETPTEYQIRDSNYYSLAAFLGDYGIRPAMYSLADDNPERLRREIRKGLEKKLLILSGGVSMGEADYVPGILEELGAEKIFHKVQVKPGKPIWFGRSRAGNIFGLPGNPVSCAATFKIFIEPYLRRLLGLPDPVRVILPMGAARRKRGEREDYFPCFLERREGRTVLLPAPFSGSGDIRAGSGAHGLAVQPGPLENMPEGFPTEFLPWKSF